MEVKSDRGILRSKRYERKANLDDKKDEEDEDPEGIGLAVKIQMTETKGEVYQR